MSAESVVAVVALLLAVIGLLVGVRTWRRLLAIQVELASANAALEKERQATAESIAAIRRSTVDEVTALLENLLKQVNTDIAAQVAEVLAVMGSDARSGAS